MRTRPDSRLQHSDGELQAGEFLCYRSPGLILWPENSRRMAASNPSPNESAVRDCSRRSKASVMNREGSGGLFAGTTFAHARDGPTNGPAARAQKSVQSRV